MCSSDLAPASDERKTKKAASLNVDTLAFDLEDGVAVNQKVRRSLVYSIYNKLLYIVLLTF